jgi:hypothetical protein
MSTPPPPRAVRISLGGVDDARTLMRGLKVHGTLVRPAS